MGYNQNIHHRKNIRLKGYDYSQTGLYFITICAKNVGTRHVVSPNIVSPNVVNPQQNQYPFGEITDGKMKLNEIGEIAYKYLNEIPNHFSHVEMGEFIVMPNHVHCVLVLHKKKDNMGISNDIETHNGVGTPNDVGTRHVVSVRDANEIPVGAQYIVPLHLPPETTININQFSKPIPGSVSVIIQQYKSSVKRWCNKNNYENFKWQSRFHDHIIRNEISFHKISEYIINNPAKWEEDKFYNI